MQAAPQKANEAVQQAAAVHTGDKALSTPPVRKFAKDNSININLVKGTGNNGRVTKDDVLAFMKGGAQPAPAQAQVQ